MDDHSRFLEEQLATLEVLVKEKGEVDVVVPAMDQEEHLRSIRSNPQPSQVISPPPATTSTNTGVPATPSSSTAAVGIAAPEAAPSKPPVVVPPPDQKASEPEVELTPSAPEVLPSAVAPADVSKP